MIFCYTTIFGKDTFYLRDSRGVRRKYGVNYFYVPLIAIYTCAVIKKYFDIMILVLGENLCSLTSQTGRKLYCS